ncbi:MAG: MFS transporter [Hyphomicrobiales bacterium]|nr:MFS transporter [Hyphomicrobiales bacterium]
MPKSPIELGATLAHANGTTTTGSLESRATIIIVTCALALSGCAELASLFFIQPLLPKLAIVYGVKVSQVSIIMSAETALLALGLLFTGTLSDRFGRKQLIVVSLLVGGLLTILCPLATSWTELVVLRALIGLSLSGIAAAAAAYISEEVVPVLATVVTGYFVFGNSVGGMAGRVIASQLMNSRPLGTIFFLFGAILISVGVFVGIFLPAQRKISGVSSPDVMAIVRDGAQHIRNLNISLVFVVSFVIFGSFTALYNFLAFHLHHAPFNMSYAHAGLISTCFVVSFITAPLSGKLAVKHGAMNVLSGLLFTMVVAIVLTALATTAWTFIAGVILFTAAFFGCHAIGLAWVSKNARQAKGQATAFYLFSYYIGGSIVGYVAGLIFVRFDWTGLASFLSALLIGAIGVTRVLQGRMAA